MNKQLCITHSKVHAQGYTPVLIHSTNCYCERYKVKTTKTQHCNLKSKNNRSLSDAAMALSTNKLVRVFVTTVKKKPMYPWEGIYALTSVINASIYIYIYIYTHTYIIIYNYY